MGVKVVCGDGAGDNDIPTLLSSSSSLLGKGWRGTVAAVTIDIFRSDAEFQKK